MPYDMDGKMFPEIVKLQENPDAVGF